MKNVSNYIFNYFKKIFDALFEKLFATFEIDKIFVNIQFDFDRTITTFK